MSKPANDPSIREEPHLRGDDTFQPDPSETRTDKTLPGTLSEDQAVEHSVWEEPALSPDLAGPVPAGELTYPRWFEQRWRETTLARSWLVTIAVALAAGPWALVGALWGNSRNAYGFLTLTVFAPVVEETMKTAAALVVVEKRPFLFRSPVQIMICVLCSALVFAGFENLLYLRILFHSPSSAMIYWRWTVCVALHVGCSAVAGLGLIRVWRHARQEHSRPDLYLAFPYAATAMIIHGAYNTFAVLLALTGFTF